MKNLLIALLFVFAATFASAQGSVLAGGPTVVNPLGQPIPGSTVAVCNTNPGSPTTGGCPGHLATLYTDVTAGTACTGTAKPLSNPGGAGSGCSNPGTVDGRGNAVAFAASGQYWCEYYGTGLTGVTVQPCVFPSTGGSFSSVNLGTLPTDFRVTSSPCSSGACLLTFDWSLSLAPNFLNQPLTLVRRDLNGDFQAGLITAGDFCLTSDPTKCLTTVGGGGSPGGPDTAVQFNDGGAFGGSADFVFDKLTGNVSITATDNDGLDAVVSSSGSPIAAVAGNATLGSGDGTNVYAFQSAVTSRSAGTLTNLISYVAQSAQNSGGGTVQNDIGLRIDPQTAGANNYGIKIGDIGAGAAGDFAIKSGLGVVQFGDETDVVLTQNSTSGNDFKVIGPDPLNLGETFDWIMSADGELDLDSSFTGDFSMLSPTLGGRATATAGTGAYRSFFIDSHNSSADGGSGLLVHQLQKSVNNTLYGIKTDTVMSSGSTLRDAVAIQAAVGNASGNAAATETGIQVFDTGDGSTNEFIGVDSTPPTSCASSASVCVAMRAQGGIQNVSATAKPTCDVAHRGIQYFTTSGAGVKDAFEVCAKDGADAYAWRTIY